MALCVECEVNHSVEATQKKLNESIVVCLYNWMGQVKETEQLCTCVRAMWTYMKTKWKILHGQNELITTSCANKDLYVDAGCVLYLCCSNNNLMYF